MVKPGLCNRREHRDEEAGGFFDEKRESVAVSTVERFEEEKVPDSSSNAVSYCKIRVKTLMQSAGIKRGQKDPIAVFRGSSNRWGLTKLLLKERRGMMFKKILKKAPARPPVPGDDIK